MGKYAEPLKDGMTSCGYIGFGRSYDAGPGEKCDRKRVELHARFVPNGDNGPEVQLLLSVANVYKGMRVVEMMGGMELSSADARELALAICPELRANAA